MKKYKINPNIVVADFTATKISMADLAAVSAWDFSDEVGYERNERVDSYNEAIRNGEEPAWSEEELEREAVEKHILEEWKINFKVEGEAPNFRTLFHYSWPDGNGGYHEGASWESTGDDAATLDDICMLLSNNDLNMKWSNTWDESIDDDGIYQPLFEKMTDAEVAEAAGLKLQYATIGMNRIGERTITIDGNTVSVGECGMPGETDVDVIEEWLYEHEEANGYYTVIEVLE